MAYTPVPSKSPGADWSADDHNTYIKDNFAAGIPDVFEARGDLAVATGADACSRFPVGEDGQVLVADSTAPLGFAWAVGSICPKHQGGSASDWTSPGTSNYTTSKPVRIVCGVIEDIDIGWSGTVDVTLPFTYTYKPIGMANCLNYSTVFANVEILSTSSIRVHWRCLVAQVGNSKLQWMVIGEVEE